LHQQAPKVLHWQIYGDLVEPAVISVRTGQLTKAKVLVAASADIPHVFSLSLSVLMAIFQMDLG